MKRSNIQPQAAAVFLQTMADGVNAFEHIECVDKE
jgi:hypothetical protein